MLDLRKNYKLSGVLSRVFFVVTFMFANWQQGLAATVIATGQSNFWLAFAVVMVTGVAGALLVPIIVSFALSLARIYSVPVGEYGILAVSFFGLGYLLRGLLNIVNFFTPVMLVWGGVIFPFIATLVASVGFYAVTSKLYFNDLTRPYYFRVCVLVFFVAVLIMEVL